MTRSTGQPRRHAAVVLPLTDSEEQKTAAAVRCLMVDDNLGVLDAARRLLTSEGIDVAGTATTSAAALRLVAELRPDVVLVDINLGSESGFELARALDQATAPEPTAVILISTHAEDDYGELIEESPAIGFLSKSSLSGAAIRDRLDRRA